MRLDDQPQNIPAITRSIRDRPVCISPNQATTQILQLATRPGAEATDAFLQNWTPMKGFANPPWCLILRCLSQIKQQQARILLITPLWPCQPWFLVVLGMLQDYPRQLPPQQDLILSPSNQEFIMQQGTPTLVA